MLASDLPHLLVEVADQSVDSTSLEQLRVIISIFLLAAESGAAFNNEETGNEEKQIEAANLRLHSLMEYKTKLSGYKSADLFVDMMCALLLAAEKIKPGTMVNIKRYCESLPPFVNNLAPQGYESIYLNLDHFCTKKAEEKSLSEADSKIFSYPAGEAAPSLSNLDLLNYVANHPGLCSFEQEFLAKPKSMLLSGLEAAKGLVNSKKPENKLHLIELLIKKLNDESTLTKAMLEAYLDFSCVVTRHSQSIFGFRDPTSYSGTNTAAGFQAYEKEVRRLLLEAPQNIEVSQNSRASLAPQEQRIIKPLCFYRRVQEDVSRRVKATDLIDSVFTADLLSGPEVGTKSGVTYLALKAEAKEWRGGQPEKVAKP